MSSLALSLDAVSIEANQDTSSSEDEESESSDLHAAAKTGDVAELTRLLNDGAAIDVNRDYWIGAPGGEAKEKTLLYTACAKGHYNVVKVLLEIGAEIRGSSNEGEHPLVAACKSGNDDIVKLLLDIGAEGADVNLTSGLCHNESGCTTLLYTACALGHADVVKVLLDCGADVNGGKEYHSYEHDYTETTTPLYAACEMQHYHDHIYNSEDDQKVTAGYVEVVKLLLKAGADVRMGKFEGEYSDTTCDTPLEAAEKHQEEDRCRYLTEACKEAIAQIVRILKKKAKELTAKTDEEYKKELTTIDAVQALTDAGARAALKALKVRGRGDTKLRREGRLDLLMKHLELN